MTLALLFGLIFVVGPLAFAHLSRGWLSPLYLASGIFTCLLTGFALQYWGAGSDAKIGSLALFWLAWVGTLAFAAARLTGRWPTTRRWSRVAGATGTTVPWFGLSTAAWIAG